MSNNNVIGNNELLNQYSTKSENLNSYIETRDNLKQIKLENDAFGISYDNQKIGETIVKIEISESKENINTSELIIILDISESMGNYVSQILNDMIPKALDKLNYDETKKCHLITFLNE